MYISTPKIEQYSGTGEKWNETYGVVRYQIRGLRRLVPAGKTVVAIFGQFERIGTREVEYSAELIADYGKIAHSYDSEFSDDLAALRAGNVEIV